MRPEARWGDPRLPAACARMGSTAPASVRPKAGGPGRASYEWGYRSSQVARGLFSDALVARGHARAAPLFEIAQSQARALADLAVLLVRPPRQQAELAAAD